MVACRRSRATSYFKGFHKQYKTFIFHGRRDILDHVIHGGSISHETVNDSSNLFSRDDMESLLIAAFGVNVPHSNNEVLDDVLGEETSKVVDYILVTFLMTNFHVDNLVNPQTHPQMMKRMPSIKSY